MTQSDSSLTSRRHTRGDSIMTQRDSLMSEFFSNKKSEREIKTFSGQFPPPSDLSDCPRSPSPASASPADNKCLDQEGLNSFNEMEWWLWTERKVFEPALQILNLTNEFCSKLHFFFLIIPTIHFYSPLDQDNINVSPVPLSASAHLPISRTRASLSQLHLRANANPRPNMKTFSTKNLTISNTSTLTSVNLWDEETESALQFDKCRERNSISSTSSKTVNLSRMPAAVGMKVFSNESRGQSYQRRCSARLQSSPTKQSLKHAISLSSASTSSSQTSGLQERWANILLELTFLVFLQNISFSGSIFFRMLERREAKQQYRRMKIMR